jgi:hypothetical protein
MRHLLEDVTSSISGREEPAENEDGLTAEEKTQLRELCVLIVISEFLEKPRDRIGHSEAAKTANIDFTTEAQRTRRSDKMRLWILV